MLNKFLENMVDLGFTAHDKYLDFKENIRKFFIDPSFDRQMAIDPDDEKEFQKWKNAQKHQPK